jgi:16S rRNA G1207 methylase RsmC
MYRDLAEWWPLVSPPAHYVDEAADLLSRLGPLPASPLPTLLELGAGGGSLAFYLKSHFQMTLTDRSPESVTLVHDRHEEGLFSRAQWLEWCREAGSPAKSAMDRWEREIFIATREA